MAAPRPRVTLPVRDLLVSTPRTRRLRLGPIASPFPFEPGQAALVGAHGQTEQRPYSFASAPYDVARERCLEFLIQLLDDGMLAGPHLEGIDAGSLVDVDGPIGTFGRGADAGVPVLLVAGGTGIAPLRSILRRLLEHGGGPTPGLVYCARTRSELAYRDELQDLSATGRLGLTLTTTREGTPGTDGSGRVSGELLASHLTDAATMCYVCGSVAFVNHVTGLLDALGVPVDRVKSEAH